MADTFKARSQIDKGVLMWNGLSFRVFVDGKLMWSVGSCRVGCDCLEEYALTDPSYTWERNGGADFATSFVRLHLADGKPVVTWL